MSSQARRSRPSRRTRRSRQRPSRSEDEGDCDDSDFDPDVAAIFTEEATELLETADQSLSSWIHDRANNALVFELKRVVHTLKGGARMAGIRAMGDLSHELETLMGLVEAGQVPAEQKVFDALQASLDELHRMRDVVASGDRCKPARELMSRIRALARRRSSEDSARPAAGADIAPADGDCSDHAGCADRARNRSSGRVHARAGVRCAGRRNRRDRELLARRQGHRLADRHRADAHRHRSAAEESCRRTGARRRRTSSEGAWRDEVAARTRSRFRRRS